MPDPLIYPPKYHAAFAGAYAKRAEEKKAEGDEEVARMDANRALYELALLCESLAYHLATKKSARNVPDLS